MKKIVYLLWVAALIPGFFVQASEAGTAYPSADNYPQMPYINQNPGPEYADSVRMFQGIPSIAAAPGGRLWVTWYGGGEGESSDNYVLLATSGDDGKTWSDPKMVIDPPFRASEPALWLDPQKRLWFMWNLYPVRSSALENRKLKEFMKFQEGKIAELKHRENLIIEACEMKVSLAKGRAEKKCGYSGTSG